MASFVSVLIIKKINKPRWEMLQLHVLYMFTRLIVIVGFVCYFCSNSSE